MLSALLLTLALSMDGMLVGFSYGARGITVPVRSLTVIAICTGTGMGISMGLGQLAGGLINGNLAHTIGGFGLILLGLWQLGQEMAKQGSQEAGTLVNWRLPSFGIVIQIIRDPEAADRDESGFIDPREAVALGVVLGLDTLAAGFAASLAGYGPMLVMFVTVGLLVLTWLGLVFGRLYGQRSMQAHNALIPALLLIITGIWELW